MLKLAQDLGANTATLAASEPAPALVKYARDHNLSRLLLGRRPRGMRVWPLRGMSEQLASLGADLDVVQIALADGAATARPTAGDDSALPAWRWQPYAMSAALCAGVTLATTPLLHVLELSNIVMLFLLAVVVVAVRYGRGPAVLASFLSVGAFDFFYVPPRFTFVVHDFEYVITFGVMLVVALVIGQLTAGLKYQAKVATLREDRVRALYEMSRDLSAALMREQVVDIGTRFLQAEFDARAAFLLTDAEDRLMAPPPGVDPGVAQWAYDHGEAAGHGTDTLPGSPMLYVPLKAPMRVRGVLALEPKNPGRLIVPEQRRLLDTFASLLAIAIERIHYVDVAQGTTLQVESERLRNSLLAAISHDLRTPLASLVGLADSLSLTPPPLAPRHVEIAHSIRDAAMRMNSLVTNLLDMARLESGKVSLNREWQPLEEVVGSALQALKPVLAGRHPLKTQLPPGLPMVHIDAVLIERVLCNLLENAAKYTPEGTPITIGAAAASDQVAVWVDDAGPGLPKGREQTIFEKFERGRKESATPGVGLGLAICRAIVEAHGGAIHGETRADGGARFTFTIPRGEPPGLDGIDDVIEAEQP